MSLRFIDNEGKRDGCWKKLEMGRLRGSSLPDLPCPVYHRDGDISCFKFMSVSLPFLYFILSLHCSFFVLDALVVAVPPASSEYDDP